MVDAQLVQQPVIQRPVVLKLQRADGMGDPFDGIGLAVGEVIGGVNTPLVAGPVVVRSQDSINHRVPKV